MAGRDEGDGQQADRWISWKIANASEREALAKAARHKPELTGRDWRMLTGIIRLTTAFTITRLIASSSLTELALEAGDMNKGDASKAGCRLRKAGIVVWESKTGPGAKILVGLPAPAESYPQGAHHNSEEVTPRERTTTPTELPPGIDPPLPSPVHSGKAERPKRKEKQQQSASTRERARTTSAVAEVAAPAARISLEEKSKSSTYERSIDPYPAVVAAADGGAAGDDAADVVATTIRGVDRDADVRTFEPERGVDPLPMAAPRPPELVALIDGLPGAALNEGTAVRAAELYAIDAKAIRGVFDRASTKANPAAYAHTALSRITEDELAGPARAPGALSPTAPDLEKIEGNARTAVARLRPQYPPEDLRAEILGAFKSLPEATVDELLAEDPQHAVDDRLPDYGADVEEVVRFADLPAEIREQLPWRRYSQQELEADRAGTNVDEPDDARGTDRDGEHDADEVELEPDVARVAERDADEHDADEVDDAQVDDKEPDDPVDDPARSGQSSPRDGYRPPTREQIAKTNAAIDAIKARRDVLRPDHTLRARAPEIVREQHELLDLLAKHDRRGQTTGRYEDLDQAQQDEINRLESTREET